MQEKEIRTERILQLVKQNQELDCLSKNGIVHNPLLKNHKFSRQVWKFIITIYVTRT